MSFIETNIIADSLVTKLMAITFETEDGETALFEGVHKFDAPDLLDALAELLEYGDRVCLVVPGPDRYEDRGSETVATLERVAQFQLVIADRDYAEGTTAYFGDSSGRKGVVGMKDLVVSSLTGENLGLDRISLMPQRGAPFEQYNEEGNRKRKAWIQNFETFAGIRKVRRRTVLNPV